MLALTGTWQLMADSASVQKENPATVIAPASQPTQSALISPPAENPPKPEAIIVTTNSVDSPKPEGNIGLAKASTTPLLDKLLEESRTWLDSVPDNRWFLQLYTAIDANRPEQVEMFLVQTRNSGVEMAQLHVYRFSSGKINRYGVIYGDYVSKTNAVKALETLPSELKRYRPYPRQTIRLRLDSNTKDEK